MTIEQFTELMEKLDTLIFLTQTVCIATCFNWGVLLMKMIIHSKNQKNII
jgi:hypothetical protein